MRPRECATALLIACAMATNVLAHPPESSGHHDDAGHPHADPASMRTWTNVKTGEVVRGAYLAARTADGGVGVGIERENGDVVVFALTELAEADRAEAQRRIDEVKAINERLAAAVIEGEQQAPQPGIVGKGASGAKPSQATPFDLFAPFVKTRWDDRWLFIESDGLPHEPVAHQLMVGIRAWQQQVPLPQAYTGENAWRIPLKPEIADKPVSAKEQLFRGAIAIAANGVPIFNPIKNDGRTDTFLAGELDEFGGHCGRADDYHYHIAPLALQKVLGKEKPVAYALDGFPIYGYFDPAAKAGQDKSCPLGGTEKLDELNGHVGAPTKAAGHGTSTASVPGLYHYHASVAYPYLNGGMRGKVTVKGDQIDPQPRASPVREAGTPLRGASITGFKTLGEKSWSLEYTLGGKKHVWNYRIEGAGKDAKYIFEFVEPDGTKKTETYTAGSRRDRPPGDNPLPDGQRPPRRGGLGGPPGDRPTRPGDAPAEQPAAPTVAASGFKLTSPAVGVDGRLPAEFSCDGASLSPPLTWAKPPAGTKSFAVTMHHIPGPPRRGDTPGEDKHVYLVLYNIPAETLAMEKGQTKAGGAASAWGWGVNTVNRQPQYAPPCSKGPGDKTYTLTVYALSTVPAIAPADRRGATMDELLAAIKETTLGTATLDVTYARPSK
jgi:phosphatidylethanolamine-binding protein (PEBP) family uncharacterized protein